MSWNKRPLYAFMYSIIKKKKSIQLEDLCKLVREEIDDVGKSEIKTALLKLEIIGSIDVVTQGDSKTIVFRGTE